MDQFASPEFTIPRAFSVSSFYFQLLLYAAPIARLCWKHSRQKTGRPCVGRKGTVVSFPHCEQLVFVSARAGEECPPPVSARFALQVLHRFGSFLKPLSAKNICSPAVNTNSAPHSAHFNTLSWYSMSRSPLVPARAGGWADFASKDLDACGDQYPGTPGADPLGLRVRSCSTNPNALPYGGLILGSAALGGVENSRATLGASRAAPVLNPFPDAASCAVASAKALL